MGELPSKETNPSERELGGFFIMRKSSTERGYNWRWRNYRVKFLNEHPLCADHQARGMIVPASVVDHKIPHHGDEQLFWNPDNHQALCDLCHNSAKQREEKSGTRPGCDTSGIPLDVRHHWHK